MTEKLRQAAEQALVALGKTMGAWGGTCAWHADVKKAATALREALAGQQDYPESPMKKVAQALREKAAAEREAFDWRIQSGEWGPEPEPGTEADSWVLPEPVSDVWTTFRGERCLTPAGDDYYTSAQVRAAYEAGRAAAPQPPAAQGDAEDAARYRWLRDAGLMWLPYEDNGCGPEFPSREGLDAAIDLAREKP